MQIHFDCRGLLLFLLVLSTCLPETYAKGGRGGGSRGGSRGRGTSSRRRPTYRPAPAPRPTQRPAPAYRPSPKPAPKPTQRPAPAPSPKPSAPEQPVVAKQPASNPNFKESGQVQGSADKQPAYNPNYKPDGSPPAGPPPPYAPAGHPSPIAPPAGPPPAYGSPGQRLPSPQQPGAQPPPYPGLPGRPPAYPGQSAPYPVQPGQGGQPYPQQPGANRPPYPVQPGQGGQPYPQQPGANRPYPVQPGYPGGYPQQPGMNRPYPVQPGSSYPGGSRPYPQQPLGGNVWQPQSGRPAPPYMNYGGMPTGTNMYAKPHKQKGFLGSLMGLGHSKSYGKKNKYFGTQPSPYGIAGAAGMAGMAGGMMGHRGGSFLGKYGKTAAMYTIMPYVAYKVGSAMFRPRFGFGYMPMFMMMPHFHHHYGYYGHDPRYAHYFNVYDDDYVGKCRKPIKHNHTEIRCKATFEDTKCDAKCEEGYEFPDNMTVISNRCWHVTGIWRPKKNFPACTPICEDDCMNGGHCIRPGVCKCPAEYRGDRCQFRKLNFLDCDARKLTKGAPNLGWVCNHSRNETVCRIRCKPPAEFESPAADEYKCTLTGEWTPSSLPHCIVKEKKEDVAVK